MGGSWSGPIIEEAGEESTAISAPQVVESTLLQLSDDTLAAILKHLPIFEMWSSFARVTHRANHIAQCVFVQQIVSWGYKDYNTLETGSMFRHEVVQELESGDLYKCECGWFYKQHNRLESNLKTMRTLNERTILQIFQSPNIYTLQKTKTVVLMTAQKLSHWNQTQLSVALTTAVIYKEVEVIKFTLQKRVNLNATVNLFASNSLSSQLAGNQYCLASPSFHTDISTLIQFGREQGYHILMLNAIFHAAIFRTGKEVILQLVTNGADPNSVNRQDLTPLHYAFNSPLHISRNGVVHIFKFDPYETALALLDQGANVNSVGPNQVTPFFCLCNVFAWGGLSSEELKRRSIFIHLLLEKYDPNPYMANQEGKTPADCLQEVADCFPNDFPMPPLPPPPDNQPG